MQFAHASTKFRNDMEAQVAFACGQLPWLKGDTPVMLEVRKDAEGREVIRGHKFVRVLDVSGIGASHEPVYTCETEGRDLVSVDQQILWPWQKLLLNERGEPSEYARWEQIKLENRRKRELAGHRTEVLLLASFPE